MYIKQESNLPLASMPPGYGVKALPCVCKAVKGAAPLI